MPAALSQRLGPIQTKLTLQADLQRQLLFCVDYKYRSNGTCCVSLPLIHMLENRIAKERRAELSRQCLSRRVGDIKTREDNYA
jgi:hypothetical protein